MPSFYDVVREHADGMPDKLALISEQDGSRSYEELASGAAALAHAFHHELKLPVGERGCLWMWNRPEWVETSMAFAAAGLSGVSANPQWADAELEFVLRHSRSRLIVCEASDAPRALALAERVETLEHVVVADAPPPHGALALADLAATAPKGASAGLPEIPDQIPGQLMYTSGTTTGRPKAVPFAREVLENAIDYVEMFGANPSDRAIFVTPLFHGNASGALSSALINGGSVVFQRRFSAQRFWALVDRSRPTYFFTLAPIVHILMGLPPNPMERSHGMRLMIALGSGPAMKAMEQRFGMPVIDWYGMTEAGMGTYTRLGEERRPGSAGRPFESGSMHILREDGSDADPGEVGEVCFDAARIGFQGYVEDSEATAAALDERWFHTGDLGYFDSDGFFFFVDRLKDVVRRGGENVSTLEVETVLMEHPDVSEIAVLGRPDPVLGERIVAFAVPQPGASAPDAESLGRFASERLASFKLPEEVIPLDTIPRTATGKVQKFVLRKRLSEG